MTFSIEVNAVFDQLPMRAFGLEISTVIFEQLPTRAFGLEIETQFSTTPMRTFSQETNATFDLDPGHRFALEVSTTFVQNPNRNFAQEVDGKFVFNSGSVTSAIRDSLADYIPARTSSHLKDELVGARSLGIRGPQISDAPAGLTTAHLNDGIFAATAPGRRKVAPNYIDAATAASSIATNAIDSSVASAKIQTGSILLTKLSGPTKERLATPDKNKFVSSPTSGDGANTGLTVVGSPVAGGYVGVIVAGVLREVGNAVTTKDCYFSSDGGTTAKDYGDVLTGDTLFWNGVVVGSNLLTTTRVDFLYAYSSS